MARITRAGLPAATTFEGRSFVTIDPAPLDELAIPVERGRQDLDRHPTTELPSRPWVDPGHPALAEHRTELVPVGEDVPKDRAALRTNLALPTGPRPYA